MRFALAFFLNLGILSAILLLLSGNFALTMVAIFVLLIVAVLAIILAEMVVRKEL